MNQDLKDFSSFQATQGLSSNLAVEKSFVLFEKLTACVPSLQTILIGNLMAAS